MVDKYMTAKARPGRLALVAENAAALVLTALLMVWIFIAVVGFMQDGFMPLAHTLMILVSIPFILLLSMLLERKRARIHARAIAGAMCVAESCSIPCRELEKITGVRDVAKVVAGLTAKGILRNVAVIRDTVRTSDCEEKQATCAYCGATLKFQEGTKVEHCPNCGSGAIEFK